MRFECRTQMFSIKVLNYFKRDSADIMLIHDSSKFIGDPSLRNAQATEIISSWNSYLNKLHSTASTYSTNLLAAFTLVCGNSKYTRLIYHKSSQIPPKHFDNATKNSNLTLIEVVLFPYYIKQIQKTYLVTSMTFVTLEVPVDCLFHFKSNFIYRVISDLCGLCQNQVSRKSMAMMHLLPKIIPCLKWPLSLNILHISLHTTTCK